MTQLAIATELHEQAIADFRVSERFAYAFIMKVKQIRDERLYKELSFQSFESYCEDAWNVKRGFMDERILLAESFGQDFDRTYGQLGHSKSLLLARMEPEIRQQIESTTDVNEATVKQLKEAEQRAKKAESESQHWQSVAKTAQNQPPKVITNTVEKIPHDYNDLRKQASITSELSAENIKLKRAVMEQKEMLTRTEKSDNAMKELKKSLGDVLRNAAMYHENSVFFFTQLNGSREAHALVTNFLNQYSDLCAKQFSEWKDLTAIKAVN